MSKQLLQKKISHIGTLFSRELKSYTGSPVVYILMFLFLATTGALFFNNFYLREQADLRAFFNLLPFIFVLLIPLITMRQFSEEQNSGTIEMLLTMPLSIAEIIIAKFLACLTLVGFMLFPTLLYVAALFFSGSPDYGPVIGGYIGSVFLGASYIAVSLFASALTRSQVAAALISVGTCFFFTLIHIVVQFLPGKIFTLLSYIGTAYHFQSISRGIIDFRDLVYFVTFTAFFLLLTHTIIEERR